MVSPVLATKLYIPQPGARTIARQRLTQQLDRGLQRKLTLISAPAGFGKTTLVSGWIASRELPVAWFSLDEADGETPRFLTYLIAALRTIAPGVGEGVLAAMQSAQPPPAETLLTALVNDLVTLSGPVVLVLDDYHAIDSQSVDAALSFLLDHMPPQLNLIVTTREDPPFSLARLRARDHLVEVRAADLRFTPEEATAFLNGMMALDLAPEDIAALEDRTEGWIAGLQLAALSLHGQQDVSSFIQAFTGSHRFVMDYLVDEVLLRQPAGIQEFLLKTSILDGLSGSLCDAVLDSQAGTGQEALEYLDRANLFLVPLDSARTWYRYHHLFAELLRQRLAQGSPGGETAELHSRASGWFERIGATADAIRHALSAADFARAADLIEREWPEVQRTRREAALLGWLRALPDEVIRARPMLTVMLAGALMSNGVLEGVEERLHDAEQWLMPGPLADGAVVADKEAYHRLPVMVAVYRAGFALVQGEVAKARVSASMALDLAPEGDHVWRGAASALLGLAAWRSGDLEAAYAGFSTGMEFLRLAGHIADAVGGSLALADIRLSQGRLHEAQLIYERGLHLAASAGDPAMRGTADMYAGLADLARERNDLAAADAFLRKCLDLGEVKGFPQHPWRWRVILAHIRAAQGDLETALTLLDEVEARYTGDFFPDVRPIAAMRARLLLAQGKSGLALAWARERGLSSTDEPDFLREYEQITFARVLLARTEPSTALSFLDRMLPVAETGGRIASVLEIQTLRVLAHHAMGESERALALLEQAITLAEPEGYVRLFLDAGPAMRQLLAEALTRGIAPDAIRPLLVAFPVEPTQPDRASDPLGDLLSQREVEVLRLIIEGCSNREIADRLYLALDTVKGHNRRIFAKLDVESRTGAIARARELGLRVP